MAVVCYVAVRPDVIEDSVLTHMKVGLRHLSLLIV